MRRIAVGDVMTRNFVHVKPSSTLLECAKKVAKERVDSLVVSEKKKLIGILTARDMLWAISKKPNLNLRKIRAIDIATKKVAVIKPSADIGEAIKKMRALSFRRLPVLSKGELIGVITFKDLLAIDPSIYSEVSTFLDIRERERKMQDIKESWPELGLCDNCGAFTELTKVENSLLCIDCRHELH